MQTTAFTTGEFTDAFLLIDAFEVKAADIGTAWDLEITDLQNVLPIGDFIKDGFLVIHAVTELID